jgi:transcriptional regulator with PAS, ATPase and Fis domain
LKIYTRKYNKSVDHISTPAIQLLERYPWPGNVRELQHAIERAVIMSEKSAIQVQDLQLYPASESGKKVEETLNLEENERRLIDRAIQKHGGNISKASKELGLTRAALYRRLEKYGVE